jgi:hypothetical protein
MMKLVSKLIKFLHVDKIVGATYYTMQNALRCFGHAGIIGGGELSDAGGGNLDVSEGSGFIRSQNWGFGLLFATDWDASNGNAIPTDSVRYIAVDYNSGSPQIILSETNNFNHHTTFRLGSVVNEDGVLHITNNPQKARDAGADMFHRIFETEPFKYAERIGGIKLSNSGTRYLILTPGELYDGLNEFPITEKNTTVSDNFTYYSKDVKIADAATQWDNTYYDNDGVRTELGVQKISVKWVYVEADDALVIQDGTGEYQTTAQAESEAAPGTIPLRLQIHGKLIGRFLFVKGADDFAIPFQSAFEQSFTAAGVASHNNLSLLQGGTAGEYFHLDSAEHVAVTKAAIPFEIDGGFAPIAAGDYGWIRIPYGFTITGYELTADIEGSIVIDLQEFNYAEYDGGSTHPVTADSIINTGASGVKPTLSSGLKSVDTTLTDWITVFPAATYLKIIVDSADTVEYVLLSLQLTKG